MADQPQYPAEFRRALQIFLKSPQTKLIRYICGSMAVDPGYALRNRRSIVRVIEDVLRTQGVDPERAFAELSVFRLIRETAVRLKIKTHGEWYARF